MVNPKIAAITVASVGLAGFKLVLAGMCLAVGFQIGHAICRKGETALTARMFKRLEKKHEEPKL